MNCKIITKGIFLILLIKIFDVSGSVVATYAKYLLKLTDRSNYTKHVTFVCWSNETVSFESPVGDNLVARGCPFNVPGKYCKCRNIDVCSSSFTISDFAYAWLANEL